MEAGDVQSVNTEGLTAILQYSCFLAWISLAENVLAYFLVLIKRFLLIIGPEPSASTLNRSN